MLTRTLRLLSVISLAGMTAACAPTSGSGTGFSRRGGLHADLSWTAQDSRSGSMTAQLSNGQVYQGTFFQLTSETRVEQLGPLWRGWGFGRHWHGWDYWGPDYGPQFVTHYSGRVVANMSTPDQQHFMRCRFHLVRPAAGMAGGGEGRCQLQDGDSLNATFPPAQG
jgi:hypothetical protein